MKHLRPVLLCVAPAILAWLVPAARDLCLYDRAAILQGEAWRLWTGHWMHFSFSHLAWNVAVLLGAGTWLERLRPGELIRYVLVAAPLMSLAFLMGEPAMHTYGGLSGLATGAVVLLALTQWAGNPRARFWWGGLLVFAMLKLTFEVSSSTPLFASFGSTAVQSSRLAHVAGAATALVFFLSRPTTPRRLLGRRPAVAGRHTQ